MAKTINNPEIWGMRIKPETNVCCVYPHTDLMGHDYFNDNCNCSPNIDYTKGFSKIIIHKMRMHGFFPAMYSEKSLEGLTLLERLEWARPGSRYVYLRPKNG